MLCRTWRKIRAEYPNAHLVMAGPEYDGNREALRAEAGPETTFTGMLRGDEKWGALSAAAIFLLPSYSEGFSMAVLEALGVGLPGDSEPPVLFPGDRKLPVRLEHRAGARRTGKGAAGSARASGGRKAGYVRAGAPPDRRALQLALDWGAYGVGAGLDAGRRAAACFGGDCRMNQPVAFPPPATAASTHPADCPVNLGAFDNSWYSSGRSKLVEALWFFFGQPLLQWALMPFSGFRAGLLRLFGAEIGPGVVIKPGVRVKYPWLLRVGGLSWIGEDVWIDNLAQVEIADKVCVSQGAYLCTGNHNWSDPAFGLIVQPIRLRAGSWAGAKCVICPGVEFGEGAVAAAGSVVVKSLEPWTIYAGNPAARVRARVIGDPRDFPRRGPAA